MRAGIGLDFVVLQATDRAIHFQNGERHLVTAADAMLAQRAIQFVHADVLSRHVRFDGLAIMNEQRGLPLNQAPEAPVSTREIGDKVIQDQQRARRHRSAGQRRVRSGHRILHRVRQQEQQREVEGSHLSDLTLPA